MAKDCSIYTCVCLCVRFVDLVDKLGQIMGCRFWMHTCTQEEEREWSNEWRTELVWTKEVYIALYIIGIKTSTPYPKGWSNEWETELATKDCFGTEEGPNWVTFLQNNNEWEQIVPASIYTSLLFAFCGRCFPKIPERIDRATFRTNSYWGKCRPVGNCGQRTNFYFPPFSAAAHQQWNFSHVLHWKSLEWNFPCHCGE